MEGIKGEGGSSREENELNADLDDTTRLDEQGSLNEERKVNCRNIVLTIFEEFEKSGYNQGVTCGKKVDELFEAFNNFFPFFDISNDVWILEKFCSFVKWSKGQEDEEFCYLKVAMRDESAFSHHIKLMVTLLYDTLLSLCPENKTQANSIGELLKCLFTLTYSIEWEIVRVKEQYKSVVTPIFNSAFSNLVTINSFYIQYKRFLLSAYTKPNSILFNYENFSLLVSLGNRALLQITDNVEERIKYYIVFVLSIPCYVTYSSSLSSVAIATPILKKITEYLAIEENFNEVVKEIEGFDKLSLLSNIIQLGQDRESELIALMHPHFIKIISKIVESLKIIRKNEYEEKKYWHDLLGWVAAPVPLHHLNSMSMLKSQLQNLWGSVYINVSFMPLFKGLVDALPPPPTPLPPQKSQRRSTTRNLMGKFFSRISTSGDCVGRGAEGGVKGVIKVYEKENYTTVGIVCKLYTKLMSTFQLSKVEILSSIGFSENSCVLVKIWELVARITVDEGDEFWENVILAPPPTLNTTYILLLFAQTLTHLICQLDDKELFEETKSFKKSKFSSFALFLSKICYRIFISSELKANSKKVLMKLKELLFVLYQRDSRKPFLSPGLWTIEDAFLMSCISDLKSGKDNPIGMIVLRELPHVISFDSRLNLLKKWINDEKTSLNGPSGTSSSSSIIRICRKNLIEDGVSQFSLLSKKALKGLIRIRFVDENGLDEAGYEQENSFTEFLRETVEKITKPSFKLFQLTEDKLIFPSKTSHSNENNVEIFEYFGKIVGKAIYEGITLNINFAHFFLSQLINNDIDKKLQSVTLEELKTMDREIFNTILSIKFYKENVEDLKLYFCEEMQINGVKQTVEFFHGGKHTLVTNSNRASYIYIKAQFHLMGETVKQKEACIRGIHSVISPEYLKIFSPHEIQIVLNGQHGPIDFEDLRTHTKYGGVFNQNHQTIKWLWDIIFNDLCEAERRVFLRAVTGSSKPPIQGFLKLDPPFSITSLNSSKKPENSSSVGHSLRSLLTPGRSATTAVSAPTSEACFNLLNLPIYSRRGILKENIKRFISANTSSSS